MVDLRHGDFLDIAQQFEDNLFDLILADIPYGTTKCKWDVVIPFEPMWKILKRISKKRAPIVLFGSEPFSSHLRLSNLKCYKYDWVWDKVLKTGHLNAKKMPMSRHELIHVFGYGGGINYYPIMEDGLPEHSYGNRKSQKSDLYGGQSSNYKDGVGNTKKYPNTLTFQKIHPSKTIHNTQKPVELMEYLIKTYSLKGGRVLDFTMGSGTTGKACLQTERLFYGIEKDKDIFNTAAREIQNFKY